jgi:hypothetical protein
LAARLASDVLDVNGLSAAVRLDRAANARSWLSTVALPTPVRQPLARLIDSTGGTAGPASQALRAVMAVTAEFLDRASRLELEQLGETLEAQALVK